MTRFGNLLNRHSDLNKEFHEKALHIPINSANWGASCCEESARNLSTTLTRCRAEPNFTGKCFGHTHERTNTSKRKCRGTRSVNVECAARSPSTRTSYYDTQHCLFVRDCDSGYYLS